MRIKLENLKKTYAGAGGTVAAVDGISLDIPENNIFGIIGKSGAGKSSLVRLVSLLETPDEGAVYYNDERVDNLSKNDLIMRRRRIGMIFQNFNLFTSRTAAKNIAYPMEICGMPKAEIESRVKEMLALVGLEDRGDAPVSTLSGGQKQRIAIARALVGKPDILILDDSTSALDYATDLKLRKALKTDLGDTSVVMISQRTTSLMDADRIIVMEDGAPVGIGTHDELLENCEVYRDIFRSQMNEKEDSHG